MTKFSSSKYLLYFILFCCLYFVFFQRLDNYPIRNWDESMYAVNAFEMNSNHNFILPHYKNLPDTWNSKPPLQIWCQVLFIKLIGYNELAIRLPSVIASSLSALLLFLFFKKRFSLTLALTVFFVFVTSFGVATFHTGRTGDSDALLSFFILCYCLSFYKWLFEGNERSLLWFFIFLSLAFLTKSVAAFLFLPALLIAVIIMKKTTLLFKNKWFYIGLILFLFLSTCYIYLRNNLFPGYLSSILNNDIGRFSNKLDSHKEPFDFYINNLFYNRFTWFLLVIPGAVLLWFHEKYKLVALFLILLLATYFIIISSSTTKLEWYDLPLFPILSVFSAYLIYVIINKTNTLKSAKYNLTMLLFIFSIPLYFSFRNTYKSEINPDEKDLEILNEYAFINKNNNSLHNTIFLTDVIDRALYFYKYKLNTEGKDFKVTSFPETIKTNDIVIVSSISLKDLLMSKYNTTIIESYKEVVKLKVNELKK